MTEFENGYEQGYKDGVAGAALPNVNDNGDKIDGYSYAYKTDNDGEPYIHIDSVRNMLKKAADVQPVDRWISVKDRLPEEIGYYLVVIGNEMLISIDIAEYSEGYWHKHDEVIYWQPLPELPKDRDTNDYDTAR